MLAEQYDIFLFDLDGVIYLGDEPLPTAVSALQQLRYMKKTIRFLTNDPRPTRDQVVTRLRSMGIEARKQEVVTAGWVTALYLHQNSIRSVYVVGSPELCMELKDIGTEIREQNVPEAVILGCDEQVTYLHLQQAARFIMQGAKFIATNPDEYFPTPNGISPATGALIAALQAMCGKMPLIVGKPFPFMFTIALQGLDPRLQVAMVGDSPKTDILGAHQLGISGILVSAISPHFPSAQDFRMPDATILDLAGLFHARLPVRLWDPPPFLWPNRVEAGVAAVIFDDSGRVLLGKRADNNLWGLPSGHIELGETVENAVIREVREETGLQVKLIHLIGIYSDPTSQVFSYSSGQISQFITSCFRCEIVNGTPQQDGTEILDLMFADVNNLPPNLLPMHPRWLLDALAQREAAFIR